MTFAGRLVAGTVLVLFFTIAILVWTAERTLQRNLQDELGRTLEVEARLAETALASSANQPATLAQLAERSGRRVELIAPDDSAAMAVAAPEIAAAIDSGAGRDIRRDDAVSPEEMYVAVRGEAGIVRIATSMTQVDGVVSRARRAMLAAALVALLIGSGLAFLAGRSIVQPLTALAGAARAIAGGTLPRFPRSGIPDIDGLVQAVRQMHRQLDDRFAELRSEQAASAALVESMLEGVIAADGRGRITTANAAARRMLGYEHDEGLPALQALFRSKAAREVVESVLGGEMVKDRQLELDGMILLVNARPLGDDGAVMVLHDLTEIRRLETVRRDFVANVSHELKTPLTSISGYAETLLADAPDAETSHRFLEIIVSNARRMQRLVDDLLDLSRIESGRWQPEPETVDVGAAVREVWAALADRAAAQGARITIDVGPGAETVEADADAVRQVLTNLIDNSLRYTGRDGTITVRSRRDGRKVELSVADDGVGIASEHLPRIFERFYRADPSRSREEGGTGLGLSIVKHLVEAHGGKVSAESEMGRGTRIVCVLPV